MRQDTDPEYIDATELLSRPGTYFFIEDGIALISWMVGANIYESDIYALPRKSGKPAKDAAKQVIDYMFCVAGAEKLIIKVPSFNRAAQLFDYGLGFRRTSVDSDAFLKDGVKYDVVVYEMRNPWAA